MYLACGTKHSAITLSPAQSGNELKPAIARPREPDAPSASYPRPHQCSESFDRPRSWAPQPRTSMIQPSPSEPHHRTTQPPRHTEPCYHCSARYTLDHPARDRLYKAQQRHLTVPLAPTSRAGITAGVLLRRPREAETHQLTLSWTPTRRMPRPARTGPTRLRARLPAELMMLSRDTVSAAPRNSRNLHMAITSRIRLLPTRQNLNPRCRETRLTPGLPR